ncbi:metabotropic glutamate receptor 2-like [Lingula anatina]|uniref:Metabotropic glutamate receptor 2-like n=1 Tax=Lingula anatina TaxID=7574 RepID=A0A1S3H7R1_LINAN|nr:metabotropic glutamate receptor 2-like [Lingula anatina]|eukprot:XP_013382155.1 metabotropic glutamate receptor 2-like [Lingula anatina]
MTLKVFQNDCLKGSDMDDKKYTVHNSFLPGFRLGAVSLDRCGNTAYVLEQLADFVQSLVSRISGPDDDGLSYTCQDGTKPELVPGPVDFHKMVGVVGGSSSTVSIYVANLLQLFKVPQISYASSSPDLSDKKRFPYFQRTVPSDANQARAIVELLTHNKWTFISALYLDNHYGRGGFSELEKRAEDAGICFALRRVVEDANLGIDYYKMLVEELLEKQDARVVVLYLYTAQVRPLFEAVDAMMSKKRESLTKLIWIGTDAWSASQSVVEGLEHVAENAIATQPMAAILPGFDDYFTNLNPGNNKRNPWFSEFWADHFNCNYGGYPIDDVLNETRQECTGSEKIDLSSGYTQQLDLHFVHDAVYAFAHALKNMHSAYCGPNFKGLCHAMTPENLNRTALLHFIKTVNFTKEATGQEFTFVNGIDGQPQYTYMHFKKFNSSEYRWSIVGNYSGGKGSPIMELSPAFLQDLKLYPGSSCREECLLGQKKDHVQDNSCCWVCTNCTENQFLPHPEECETCDLGTWPNREYNACEPLPLTHMSHLSAWAIGPCVFAVVGMVLCIVIGIVFYVYRDTPVIMASGRELSYVLLAGIFLSYSSPLIFVAKPSPITCALTRILLGVCYTVCYAAILTKTNRIARIFFHDASSTTKTKFTDQKSCLMIVFFFTLVELIILAVWMILVPPEADHIYPTKRENILICAGGDGFDYLLALAYPFLLIILCTVYAVKTRKTPDGFNEARYIAFTNYTTCVLWLAFVTMYIATPTHDIRVFTMCMAVALSGTVQLVCLFMPKVYTVLLHPEKNTRQAVMTKKKSTIITSTGTSGGKGSFSQKTHEKISDSVRLAIPATDNCSSGIMSVDSALNLSQTIDAKGHRSTPRCVSIQEIQTTVETHAVTNQPHGALLTEKHGTDFSDTAREQKEQELKRTSGIFGGGQHWRYHPRIPGAKDTFSNPPLYTSRSKPSSLYVIPLGDDTVRSHVTSTSRTDSRSMHVNRTEEDLSRLRSLRQIHSAPNSRPGSPYDTMLWQIEKLSGSHYQLNL